MDVPTPAIRCHHVARASKCTDERLDIATFAMASKWAVDFFAPLYCWLLPPERDVGTLSTFKAMFSEGGERAEYGDLFADHEWIIARDRADRIVGFMGMDPRTCRQELFLTWVFVSKDKSAHLVLREMLSVAADVARSFCCTRISVDSADGVEIIQAYARLGFSVVPPQCMVEMCDGSRMSIAEVIRRYRGRSPTIHMPAILIRAGLTNASLRNAADDAMHYLTADRETSIVVHGEFAEKFAQLFFPVDPSVMVTETVLDGRGPEFSGLRVARRAISLSRAV